MPTYVYLTTQAPGEVSLSLVNTGPDTAFWGDFKLERTSVPANSNETRVMQVDRNPGVFDHTTVAELRLSIGGRFIIALEVMLSSGTSPIKSAIWWGWRAATRETGRFETDHNPHVASVSVGGWNYTFTVQGRGTVGFDDIYITLVAAIDRARWMEALGGVIGGRPLNTVRLPGSHDSGTATITANSAFAPDSSWWHQFAPGTVANWARSQSRTIAQQLADGIRYFDLRVAPAAAGGGFVLVHAMEGERVDAALAAVAAFLRANPFEIVILDFNHFFNMTAELHNQLVGLITGTLGVATIAPPARRPTVTPRDLWAGTERVIVAYADDATVDRFPTVLWRRQEGATSTIAAPFPDTNDIDTLHTFLTDRLAVRRMDRFFVLQGILTPGVQQIASWTSLEQWATDVTNPAVRGWAVNEWAARQPNIIMVDFYERNDIAGTVIDMNR